MRQSSLAGGLSRPINIEDLPLGSLPVPEPSRGLLLLQRSGQQVFEKDHAQRLDCLLVQAGEKVRKRRAVRQAIAVEQRHKRGRKRREPLIEGFERAFGTDGVPQEHDDKVNEVILPEVTPGEARSLHNARKQALTFQKVCHHGHFAEPGWRRGNRLRRGLDVDRKIGDTDQWSSLNHGNVSFFPLKEAHFYTCLLLLTTSLRNPWVVRPSTLLVRT